MQGRRMCKKLLIMLMCMCVLVAGCSKKPSAAKPLKSMTIGQVRQLVLDWGYGKLPEQQVEGADEIRKELEVLENEELERKVELEREIERLREGKCRPHNMALLQIDQRRQQVAEWRRSNIPQEELAKLTSELQNRQRRLWQECKEQEEVVSKKIASLLRELPDLYSEFYIKKEPLEDRLRPDKSVKTFYKVFGKPKDKSLIGNRYYFQYRCKDGIVLLEIHASQFDYDHVAIMDVSVL